MTATNKIGPYRADVVSRREWTTKCADPTVVVEWKIFGTSGTPDGPVDKENFLTITEFQGVYRAEVTSTGPSKKFEFDGEIAKSIHCQLEDAWQEQQHRAEEKAMFEDLIESEDPRKHRF